MKSETLINLSTAAAAMMDKTKQKLGATKTFSDKKLLIRDILDGAMRHSLPGGMNMSGFKATKKNYGHKVNSSVIRGATQIRRMGLAK